MKKLFEEWFNTTSQGVTFVEPIRIDGGEITDFRYQLVNESFARILRQSRDELNGQVAGKFFQPEPANDFFLPAVNVIETGEALKLLKPYKFDKQTVWLNVTLTRLDRQLIVHVEDVSDSQQAEQKLQRRLLMESIVSAIASRFITLDTSRVDDSIVAALEEISLQINAERASVFFYADDFQTGTCLHEWCAPGINSRKEKVSVRPRDCFAWTRPKLENGQIIRLQVDELAAGDTQQKAFFDFLSVYSMIAVPLIQDGKTRGFLGFYTINTPPTWDQHDVSLLETFATLVANVLQRQVQETALRRANQRLENLRAIDQALLNYRLAEQSPLEITMQYMHLMVPCNRIIVFQFDETTNMAVARCRINDGKLMMNPGLTVPAQYVYRPYESGKQPSYYPDIKPDTPGITSELRIYEQGFRSMIIIHLYNGDKPIGALALAALQPFFFTEEQQIGTIESGKVSFNPRWVDIILICEEITTTHFKQRADHRSVRLLLEGTPSPVYLDKKLISHVLVNLLSNAFKFSSLDPCLRIVFDNNQLILEVIDEGIGIPAQEMNTLFEAFFRASNTGAIAGTGLDLLIARQFVELHGGQLKLNSEENKGTTCQLILPVSGTLTEPMNTSARQDQIETDLQPIDNQRYIYP